MMRGKECDDVFYARVLAAEITSSNERSCSHTRAGVPECLQVDPAILESPVHHNPSPQPPQPAGRYGLPLAKRTRFGWAPRAAVCRGKRPEIANEANKDEGGGVRCAMGLLYREQCSHAFGEGSRIGM